jgi:hypothetical protein
MPARRELTMGAREMGRTRGPASGRTGEDKIGKARYNA